MTNNIEANIKHDISPNPHSTDQNDVKVVSLEDLLSFGRRSLSPSMDWANAIDMDDLLINGSSNSIDIKVNSTDEKIPYEPVQKNMTPPPLKGYMGGQLLISGNRDEGNIRRNDNDKHNNIADRMVPKLGLLYDFLDKDSELSSGPPSLSLPDENNIFDCNMYGDLTDDTGIDEWST